jgi:hypothetical protein
MAELSKFDELRIKTDQQLIQIIHHGLDLGILHARQALRSDTWVVAAECCHRAKTSYVYMSRLVPLVDFATEDRRSVESRLEYLKGMLESLSAIGLTPSPTEDEIAVLARAVWEARGCPEGSPEHDWFLAERALKAHKIAVCFV